MPTSSEYEFRLRTMENDIHELQRQALHTAVDLRVDLPEFTKKPRLNVSKTATTPLSEQSNIVPLFPLELHPTH